MRPRIGCAVLLVALVAGCTSAPESAVVQPLDLPASPAPRMNETRYSESFHVMAAVRRPGSTECGGHVFVNLVGQAEHVLAVPSNATHLTLDVSERPSTQSYVCVAWPGTERLERFRDSVKITVPVRKLSRLRVVVTPDPEAPAIGVEWAYEVRATFRLS